MTEDCGKTVISYQVFVKQNNKIGNGYKRYTADITIHWILFLHNASFYSVFQIHFNWST